MKKIAILVDLELSKKAGGHVTNTSRFREIRKDVARARLALGQLTAKK